MKKIWDKGTVINRAVEKFTVGNDMTYDMMMAEWDITATLAHARMLSAVRLIEQNEFISLADVLSSLFDTLEKNQLELPADAEDIHSVIESELITVLGDTGRKIHAGRSRNDQVLTASRLYVRDQMKGVAGKVALLSDLLVARAQNYSDVLMPGYTHMQIAMLSTFGMWFGSYAESLADDLLVMHSAWDLNNRNPLGTAAGYGSDLPVDRDLTTELLQFDGLNLISPYAQLSRGKVERTVASALSSVAYTLSRMAADIVLYNGQNFGFFKLPEGMTTGSSIMPQKKNPDVVELIRGRCNRIQALPNEITLLMANMPSGYHRDTQLLKEILFPAFNELINSLDMAIMLVRSIGVNRELLSNRLYNPLLSTNEVNRLVKEGVPFREAYRRVSDLVETSTFQAPELSSYTHKGSPGNLCLDEITGRTASLRKHFTSPPARELFESIKKG